MIKKALDSNLNSNSLNDKQRKDFIRYFKNKEGALIFKYWNKEKVHITSPANQTPPKEKRASKIKKFLFHPLLRNSTAIALGMAYYCCSKKYPDIFNQLRKRNNQKSL